MFLEFTEGSFLWDWHHSPLGVVAFWVSLMVTTLMMRYRTRTYTGRILRILAIGSLFLTLPLGFVQMGLAPDILNSALVSELGVIGFIGSVGVVALPSMVGIIICGFKPDLLENAPVVTRFRDPFSRYMAPFEDSQINDDATNLRIPVGSDDGETSEPAEWELEFLTGSSSGKKIRMPRSEMTLGRSPHSDLIIEDPYVSRKHATISVRRDGPYLTDLGSTSGSFVGGIAVQSSALLEGSEIVLGETVIKFTKC